MRGPATPYALTGSDQIVVTGPTVYRGFAVDETSTSVSAKLRIYDGVSAAGKLIDVIQLSADESAREYYESGIRCADGLYVDVVSGSVEGSLRVG